MFDLVMAICVVMTISIIGFFIGYRLSGSTRSSNIAALAAVMLTFLFATLVHGKLFLAEIIPFTNAIILGNLLPVFAGLLAGVVRNQMGIPAWRRTILSLFLLAMGWVTVVCHLFPQNFQSKNCYLNGVCLQSTPATCGACSAVTLLNYHGIEANEEEMSRLCLSSGRGTNALGICRGLREKTEGTPYRVEIVRGDFEELMQANKYPVLIFVRRASLGAIEPYSSENDLFTLLTQLLGRTDHCVVLFSCTDDDRARIGDPANSLFNPIEQSAAKLRRDWLGEGIRLVKR